MRAPRPKRGGRPRREQRRRGGAASSSAPTRPLAARLAAVAAAAALAACTPRVPPPDLALEPEALLAQVEATAAAIQSVRGEVRVRTKGQEHVSVPAFVAAGKPSSLHLEALDFFGNPVAVLVVHEGRLSIYDARDRTFYRGRATPENVARLVPLPIAPEELVAALCGAPLLAGEPVRADPGRGHVTLELRDGRRTTTLRVVEGAAVERAEVRVRGAGGYRVVYGRPYAATGADEPGDLTLTSAEPPVQVELGWVDHEANAALAPELFRMEPPAAARVVDLDAAGGSSVPPPVFPAEPAP
jgi:hypothetical protein